MYSIGLEFFFRELLQAASVITILLNGLLMKAPETATTLAPVA